MNSKILRISLMLATLSILASVFAEMNVAYAQPQRGPQMDILRNKITRSPAAQLIEMTTGAPLGSDIQTGLIRPSDIETHDAQGRTISSRSGFHYGRIGFNLRRPPCNNVNYRHALAHLLPRNLIVGTIFKYVVLPVTSMVPPAQALYTNPNVDPHPYSRAEAEQILLDSGDFEKVDGVWRYINDQPLENCRFFTPLETTAPTSYTMGRMFADECRAIGVMNVDHQPADFSTYVDMVMNQWEFEMFMIFHSLGRFPTQLYTQMHTANNFLGSANPHGITTPGVIIGGESYDYHANIVWTSLNPADIEASAKKAQELLMGGSTTDPLLSPAQNTATDNRTMAIPHIPIYSRNLYDIQNQLLRGSVNYFGVGVHNGYTWNTLYWDTPGNARPGQALEQGPTGPTNKMVVYVQTEYPDATLNPLFSTTVYSQTDIIGHLFDALTAVNPYNHRDEDWLASSWSFAAQPGGMYVEFTLRTTDNLGQPILWQDGTQCTPADVKFAWDFLGPQTVTPRPHGGWHIPTRWSVMQFYRGCTINGNVIRANFSTTSPWYIYTLSGNAYQLPPQVWMHDPNGVDWASQAAILGYRPTMYTYNVGACANRLFGNGPFVLRSNVEQFRGPAGYGDMWANRNYWLTTAEFETLVSEMFERSGDADENKVVDVADLAAIGANMWTAGPLGDIIGPIAPTPGPWPGAKKDGEVNSLDLAVAGKYYGETERVP